MQDDRIEELRNDHLSGSLEILQKAAEILKEHSNPEIIEKVRATHPDMAALHNLCARVEQSDQPNTAIDRFLHSIKKSPEVLGNKLLPLIKDEAVIMTYSRSSTVKDTLLYLYRQEKAFSVYIAESRPLCEGRILAEELGEAGIPTTLMTDATALSYLLEVDHLFLGADRVSSPIFVNKIGTYPFVKLAQLNGIPCSLLADQSKVVNYWPWETDRKTHDPSEVCAQKMQGVHIVNPYYEEIPLDLVSLISDD